MLKAHRLAWELVNGPIPPGLCVCHRCDNRRCVNVEHLFLGTNSDNVADMVAKGRNKSMPPHADNPLRGESVGTAKLTSDAVVRMRARYSGGGISIEALGMEFGVSHAAAQRVIARTHWKHVP
jgi:hypothetical protein